MAPDPALTAQALVLVQAQAATREQITVATQASVAASIRAFLAQHGGAGFFDSAAVTRLAKQLAATTRAGQRATSTSTAAYWARTIALLTDRRPAPARLVDVATVRPVPMDAVYGRLADQWRWLQASRGPDTTPEVRLKFAEQAHLRKLQRRAATLDHADLGVVHGEAVTSRLGHPGADLSPQELAARLDALVREHPAPTIPPDILPDDAIAERIVRRATGVADAVLSETLRAQIEAAAAKDPTKIRFYRRIPHPELGNVCGLCLAVSTRVFTRGNLLPLHPACRCTVLGILGEAGGDGDVGGAVNEADLSAIYAEAGGTTDGRALSQTRFRIVNHPERGPYLVAGSGSTVTLLPQGSAA